MHNSDWIALFRQLPPALHPQMVLSLKNRCEVSVEVLFRIEPTFLVIRGRMGGTTEGGLLFLVPFEQISNVYMHKQMPESEVEAIFGPPKTPSRLLTPSRQSARPVMPAPVAEPAVPAGPPAAAAAMPAFGRPSEATAVARNNLLERLRAARQAASPPPNSK